MDPHISPSLTCFSPALIIVHPMKTVALNTVLTFLVIDERINLVSLSHKQKSAYEISLLKIFVPWSVLPKLRPMENFFL